MIENYLKQIIEEKRIPGIAIAFVDNDDVAY